MRLILTEFQKFDILTKKIDPMRYHTAPDRKQTLITPRKFKNNLNPLNLEKRAPGGLY